MAEMEDSIERFDYAFDKTLIAAAPMKPRDASRLLTYDRKTEKVTHQQFSSLLDLLHPNDLLIVNNTRVFPARLHAHKGLSGGKVELLLLKEVVPLHWEVMVKGHITPETVLTLNGGGKARFVKVLSGGRKVFAFLLADPSDLYAYLDQWGEVPLPPYILQRRKACGLTEERDADLYQTVYAKKAAEAKLLGSSAAPTAGLHFTKRLIASLRNKGIAMATVTLKIGLDTFKPIAADRLSHHKMGGEIFEISTQTANAIAKAKARGGRVIAVGTSATRSIESATNSEGIVIPMRAETKLFISPGYIFRGIDGLITNFHPPRASGLVLVSAFLGYNVMSRLYQQAFEKRYRLFSYGDAMLIL
jgi:S-adenosylmethionine:tRNA ribosyltransferase-isomerase